MTETTLRYDKMVEDALRGVVRACLSQAVETGLPGDHHFYITFHTKAPGVSLPEALLERYPEEMTIILQHQFWDLKMSDDIFEVTLSFDSVPRHLVIPFAAITSFFDPSVQFGLKFEVTDQEAPQAFEPAANADQAQDEAEADDEPGQVITLDAFRKK
ncbi:MAG: hypothetical protein GY953_57095 [bacterium]|nr:hypothetical protein [bacterium]